MKLRRFFGMTLIIFVMSMAIGCESEDIKKDYTGLTDEEYKELFDGENGGFILYDEVMKQYYIYNEEQVNKQMSPCSSFKVFNSLIGLDTGVIQDENHKYKWDGKIRFLEVWNKDHTLESAIANSVVWYYQRLATEVGNVRMNKYIDSIGYGNKDISGGIDRFWLDSSLKISPREQVDLLKKLYNNELPFEQKNIDIVKDILVLEKDDGFILSGKTGTGEHSQVGWFIGCIQKGDKNFYFATNIIGSKNATGRQAKEVTKEILDRIGLING